MFVQTTCSSTQDKPQNGRKAVSGLYRLYVIEYKAEVYI